MLIKRRLMANLVRGVQTGTLVLILILNKGFAENLKKMNNNSKAFNFKPEDDDFRPLSKETVSQTQTSSPFDKGSIETDPKVYEFLDGLKLSKY
jgi:hypothetical protein